MSDRLWIPILSGEDRSFAAAAKRAALAGSEPFYGIAMGIRNALFDSRLRKAHPLARTTISIGNITTGGTGKTPMVIDVARRLITLDARPAVLLRGYRAVHGRSDEAELLKQALGPSVPVIANPDRIAGAKLALIQNPATTLFILDDGFQHRKVARDLDLVLVDATNPFGYGHLLPRGLLREPIGNLRRARGVIVTRADLVSAEALRQLDRDLTHHTGRPPLAHCAHVWTGFLDAEDRPLAVDALAARRVLAFSGIGNPQAFEATLRTRVLQVEHHLQLPDHHDYADPAPLRAAYEAARGAECLVMTEKDWVKCKPRLEGGKLPGVPLPIFRPVLGIRYLSGEAAIENLLTLTVTAATKG